ncbi:MAG TPA: carbohydrate kinase family protein [Verrucomicrobiota bacterium]|nr:carbohydrate kinase family protein [Verrucomicrobiota bacterium]
MLTEDLLKNGQLCVVGNINRDVKTTPFAGGAGLLRDGETAVDAIYETVGGGGANSAFAAAALGARVAFLGKVGTDLLGDRLETMLAKKGIGGKLARDPAHQTGTSLALMYVNGQRHFVSCQPNNASLRFEDLDLAVLPDFKHLFRADVWFSEAMLFGGNARLFQAARQAGMVVSLDLNWDPRWGVAPEEEVLRRKRAIREVLPLVDVAHGNVRELNTFTGCSDLDASLVRLADWGVGAVVVHMGQAGAGYYERGQWVVVPAVPVARHVNATGCGDVLSVCMMLLHQQPHPKAKLSLANRIVAEFIEGRRNLVPSLA